MSNISTAFAIQQACSEELFNPENAIYAAQIAELTNNSDEILHLLFQYAASLSAGVAARVTEIAMPHSEFIAMMSEVKELESLGGSN